MPFKIQRVPRGLQNLLSTSGGETPAELEERIRGSVELLQFYGAPARQLFSGSNAALTEGTAIGLGPPGPAILASAPFLLFGASLSVVQTATLTALSMSIWLGIPPGGYAVKSREFTQFGATVTGAKKLSWYAPYPILMPSGSSAGVSVFGTVDIIGTDANVSAGLTIDVAPLT